MLTRKQLEDLKDCDIDKDCEGCSCFGVCMAADNEAAQTALALADMLKRLEWVPDEIGGHSCLICGGTKAGGHMEGCELAALLRGLETEK